MADLTPMMRQYLEIKEQNKDSILFFRLGDFYEMFNEDAKLAARELDLVLTTRDRGKSAEEQTPMCGIPYHSSDGYIARLIAKGYKVAICEQTEDPALAKGLVKRDIIRVVTPGTVIDSACLDDRRGNFLCGVFLDEQNAGVAFCDMSTGHTHVTAFSGADRAEHLCNELARFSPAEAVLSAGAYADEELKALLADRLSCRVERGDARFDLKAAEKAVLAQYGEDAYASLPRNNPAAALALGGLSKGVTTRAQLVQVLYNLEGKPDVSDVAVPFTDAASGWYRDAVAWAYKTGVVDGMSPTTFAPNNTVTREQVAVILMRYLTKVCGVERTWTPDDLSGFADGGSVSGWARAGMADAVALGLFGGTQDSSGQVWLRPGAGTTRAETAALLQRMCTKVLGIG